jgi:catechol 2,3-dioxygenase-like lactoylglutathione lyase family enzyme
MQCLNVHHVGIWADDVEEMVSFLTEVLGFELVKRQPLDPGERVFVHLGDRQLFEVLSVPGMRSRPDIAPHMAPGASPVVGVPHICLRVTDLPAWEERIRSSGFRINNHWPAGGGFGHWELGATRTIWFTGPSGVDFELFEFDEEYPLRAIHSGDTHQERPPGSDKAHP